MTTIIAMNTLDDQAIYADSLINGSGIATPYSRKIMSLPPRCVMGSCGLAYVECMVYARLASYQRTADLHDIFVYTHMLEPLTLKPEDTKDFEMLLLFEGTTYVMFEELVPVCIPGPWTARGSGAHFAIGALSAGASPLQALRIAAQYDIGTAGPFFRMDMTGKLDCFPATWEA